VVEDDSAGAALGGETVSLGRWRPERTAYIRSFSKSHGPDLRLAALSAPADLLRALEARRQVGQGWSSRLLQRILLSLLTDPVAVAEVEQAAREYARRRAVVVDALAEHGVEVDGAEGINIWVPVQDETAAVVRLASAGIGVTPGSPFTLLPGEGDHVRVTVGLAREGYAEVAAEIAAAARTPGWRPGVR
jgi:DNA-binding transcriptional MocR family regulator